MTIADVIEGKRPVSDDEVEDLKAQLKTLEAELNRAHDPSRCRLLKNIRRRFLTTDLGFALITVGKWEVQNG